MLQTLSRLHGATVHALDGDLGTVDDFYFDDERWTIRYAVVSTGGWLSGRQVLLSVISLLTPDWEERRLPVRLTRAQVRDSPDVDTHRPVSRAQEAAVLSHYSYPFYWAGPDVWGPVPSPAIAAETAAAEPATPASPPANEEDRHLRSVREVIGYHIHAADGEIGHIDDFLVETGAWTIDYALIDTSNWIGGRAVVIQPSAIRAVSWADRRVEVSLPRETIKNSPHPDAVLRR